MNAALWRTRFQEHMQVRGWSPRTVEQYGAEVRGFFEFLEAVGVTDLASVTREVIEEYRTHLFFAEHRGRKIGARTQSARLSAVKAFVKYLNRERFILIDPAAHVELPRVPRTVPRVLLSEAEVERLLAAPDPRTVLGRRDRAILEVFYGTGLRNSELCRLVLDEVDRERKEIRLQRGKGGKGRVVPLGGEAAAWLDAYLERSRPVLARSPRETLVFLTSRGGLFSRATICAVVRRAAEAAGLEKAVTPHTLRHCCATHMLRGGAGVRHLQKLLGHACLTTTQRYTTVEVTDLRKVLQQCHPRERGRAQ